MDKVQLKRQVDLRLRVPRPSHQEADLIEQEHCINSQTRPETQKEDSSVDREVMMTADKIGYSLRCIIISICARYFITDVPVDAIASETPPHHSHTQPKPKAQC